MLNVVYGVVILALTVFAGIFPLRKHAKSAEHPFDFRSGESLACGIFLGAGLLHMLGEASDLFNKHGFHYPVAFLLCGSVFLLFLWLEHLGKECYQHRSQHQNYFAVVAVFMMSIHSLLAGSALGLSDDTSVSAIIFLAIISHKLAESFAIAVQLMKSGFSAKVSVVYFAIYALMTPLGIAFGYLMIQNHHEFHSLLIPIFMALASGTFLYLGTLHGLEKCVLVKQCCNLKYFSFVILGFVIMAVMAVFV